MNSKEKSSNTYNKRLKLSFMKSWYSGFTLVELLFVIGIISILVTLSLFAVRGTREGARDARRRTDLETMRQALEMYKADCGTYPQSWSTSMGELKNGLPFDCQGSGDNVYLQERPTDPLPNLTYQYRAYNADGTAICSSNCPRYRIWAHLENQPASLPPGCTSPPSCGAEACNYCVTNP